MGRRRPAGLLLLVIGLGIALGALLSSGDDDPSSPLASELTNADARARFAFSYVRGGTRVLDCLRPNRSFHGDVLRPAARTVIRRDRAANEPIAIVDEEGSLLHRSLFEDPPFRTSWLLVPTSAAVRYQSQLAESLGPDLAGYVVAGRGPDSGEQTTTALLEVATRTRRIPAGEGRPDDRYRIIVSAADYREATDRSPESGTAGLVPVVDVWLDARGRVVRLGIEATKSSTGQPVPEASYSIDFEAVDHPPTASPARLSTTNPTPAILARLQPARLPCRVGS